MDDSHIDLDALSEVLGCDVSRRGLLRRVARGGLAAAMGAGGLRLTPPAAAREARPAASPVAAPYRFALGAFTVTAVSDGFITAPNDLFPVPPQEMLFVDAPPDELEAALREAGLGDWIDAPDAASATFPNTPLVVDTGQNVVLIDTGMGAATLFPGTGHLLPSLATAGIDSAAIDTVFFTHGHIDHIMGATDGAGSPAFPNARYVMGRTEHAFWTDRARVDETFSDPAARELQLQVGLTSTQATLPAIASRLALVDEAEEEEFVPGLRAVAAYGHTPGHAAVIVASEGEQLLVAGDVLTHPLHVTYPDWNFVTDSLPSQTETTRRGLLDRAADEGMLVQVYHARFPGLGRVVPDGDLLRWQPAA